MDRRTFLSLLTAATACRILSAENSAPKRHLVLIEMQGGNDGLNTVVPYADDNYQKLRPTLAIASDQLLKLDERAALHPALAALMEAWEAKQIAIVQGLGYDKPNRSHFRSHDIWTSASQSDERKTTGWLADVLSGSRDEVQALVFGNRSAVFDGGGLNFISMQRTRDFLDGKLPELRPLPQSASAAQRHVHGVLRDTVAYQIRVKSQAESLRIKGADNGGEFGNNLFGKQLQDVASLIAAGLAPSVITLHLNGFDTHANQLVRQHEKLTHLATGLAAFRKSMIEQNLWKNILVVTWSEFGRRVAENASGGTDHGAAAPQLVIGGRVKGGLHGQQPSLTELQNDDLVHTVDFKQLYATVLAHWWQTPNALASDPKLPLLDLLKSG